VYGDPDRLTQILTNLIGNAYKYTPTGGSVTVHGYVREGMFHVAVADTGIGISKEDQRQIFERFFRVDDPTVHEMAGTGLGLAITVSLVHLHGGEIWVESELGEGSIFFSSFPLAEGESTADVGKPPLGFARPDFTVLVVEDDVEIAEMIRVALENEGRKVLVSHSGEEALHLAREHHPDMISLDIRLPDLDGFEVLELLKRDVETADIPVVVVSVVPDAERGLRLGAVDYLTKPVDQEILLRAVDRCLAQREVVLVVDDDKETQQLLRTALRARGLTVRATRQGDRALRLAQELHPGLILLDLKLPGMDGFAVLEQLKGNTRTADIPVIVMTGSFSETEGKAQAVEALGALRFLTKPFSVEELAEEISHLVDGKDPQKELGA
ncbi:MAG TPA: response regulator, partial [Chloroflexi bacterium]|nr:response regulator [Chloroflexota bacterium]